MNGVPVKPFQNDWNRKYIPSRGLLYSFLVHELVFFGCFSYSILSLPKNQLLSPDQEIHAAELTYLPDVGGGDEGGSEGAKSREGEGDRSESGPKKAGVTFRGPQFIRSNPAHPDNHLQTVLQPELVVAPKLNFPLQFPNLVKIAPPKPVELITPKPDAPKLLAPPVPQLVAKLDNQALATPLRSEVEHLLTTPPLEAKEKPPVQPLPVAPEAPAARPAPPVMTADAAMGDHSIAVLNAIQITAKPTIMPPGEKLGSFEVSPNGSATASGSTTLGPGSPGGTANGVSSNGSGKSEKTGAGGSGHGTAKAGEGAGASGTGKGAASTSAGNGIGLGKGTVGKGLGISGKGIGNGSGATKGGGAGGGNGIGTGAGTGAGAGPFADLEVIGGAGSGFQGGSATRPALKASVPRGYDLNIIASGGSGGGLKDFGVFHNEAVYTVYMDVSDVIAGSRSWVLQYADYGASRTTEINLDGPPTVQSMLEPPIATTREAAPAPASPTSGTMTVVTGLINAEGKFTSSRVLQSSTEDRGKQWLATLDKWHFQSASKAGKPTTVRVIIGIPEF